MKAISLWQPWASLIACGVKPYETRHWPPPEPLMGQRIAIHAAKKIDREGFDFVDDLMDPDYFGLADRIQRTFSRAPEEMLAKFGKARLPIGAFVCTAVLDAAFLLGPPAENTAVRAASVKTRVISRPMPQCFTVRYDDFGNYEEGRWAWLLRDVIVIDPPVVAKGRQAFFDVERDVVQIIVGRAR